MTQNQVEFILNSLLLKGHISHREYSAIRKGLWINEFYLLEVLVKDYCIPAYSVCESNGQYYQSLVSKLPRDQLRKLGLARLDETFS